MVARRPLAAVSIRRIKVNLGELDLDAGRLNRSIREDGAMLRTLLRAKRSRLEGTESLIEVEPPDPADLEGAWDPAFLQHPAQRDPANA